MIGHSPGAQNAGSPFPTSSEDEEMTYDQAWLIRRCGKVRKPGTGSGQLAMEDIIE
jgi:hypothetical protein